MTTPSFRTKLDDRGLLRVGGPDRVDFLQGLITNDVAAIPAGTARYAWLLTPQGRFLHEMIVRDDGDSLLLDVEAARRDDLLKRLTRFRLRAKVELADVTSDFSVWAGWGAPRDATEWPELAIHHPDPRLDALGSRALLPAGADLHANATRDDWDLHRLTVGVPDGSRDCPVEDALAVESNLDLLHGVAWDKGCYVGQELTARTHFRALVKKRLAPVVIDGDAPSFGAILSDASGKELGEMRSSNRGRGLALLRTDAINGDVTLHAGTAKLTVQRPDWLITHG
ncbi:YgfZ/GcvT domain-containing protein [Roseiterribacter gracilis]|uniref:Glycine cleavage system protein T n=1 Tax=Roseiterribacter gracilis TaxID=2812848 RepID=A0A8S8X5Z7_9PROT|nr:glycine cleavage system protein T [Rhodospirillales bacterium TMPK1]